MLHPTTYQFLRDLAKNNDRDWFQANKKRYESARADAARLAQQFHDRLSEHDRLETESGKKALFRIYRDVRFSKNKAPYKINLAGHFVRDGKLRRGGYYFSFSPGENMIGGGFYGIERDDLKRIREEIAVDADPLREVMADPDFVRHFGTMQGEKLKTAPQGYSKEHPNIDLLRFKQYYVMREFSQKEVCSEGFVDEAVSAFLALRPFFDLFSDILTTDANGEIIV